MPEDESCERADVESRDDEDVEDARFLEGDGFVAIDEGAVAEEHGAEMAAD